MQCILLNSKYRQSVVNTVRKRNRLKIINRLSHFKKAERLGKVRNPVNIVMTNYPLQ